METYLESKKELDLIKLVERSSIEDCLTDESPVLFSSFRKNEDKMLEITTAILTACVRQSIQTELQASHFASLALFILSEFPSWRMTDVPSYVKFIGKSQVDLKSYGKPDLLYFKMMCGEYNAVREEKRVELRNRNKERGGKRSSTEGNTLKDIL